MSPADVPGRGDDVRVRQNGRRRGQIAVVADAVYRARGGELRDRAGHRRGRRRTAAPPSPQPAAGRARPTANDRRSRGQRGQAAAPALLSRGRLGLGGGGLRVHGASAQPRAAVVVRRAREGRDPRVPGRHLRQDRSVNRRPIQKCRSDRRETVILLSLGGNARIRLEAAIGNVEIIIFRSNYSVSVTPPPPSTEQ